MRDEDYLGHFISFVQKNNHFSIKENKNFYWNSSNVWSLEYPQVIWEFADEESKPKTFRGLGYLKDLDGLKEGYQKPLDERGVSYLEPLIIP